MKLISLTQGKFAKISDEDFELVNQFKWCFSHGYAYRKENNKTIYMHRIILWAKRVDHINGDRLDNQRHNLREVSHTENLQNAGISKRNKSGFKGVCWSASRKKWRSTIVVNKKQIHLGEFVEKWQAALAYQTAAVKYFGDYARFV